MKKKELPEIEIIDLEDADSPDESNENGGDDRSGKKKSPINIHIVLLAVTVVTFSVILYKYLNWGQLVEQDDNSTEPEGYTVESYDNILPLTDEDGNIVAPNLEDGLTIAVFGNGPFAEDRDSEEGLANMLAKAAGATVFNCSLSGSYLASAQPVPDVSVNPRDAFTLYWMSLYSSDIEVIDFYGQALEALGQDAPPEAAKVRETMSSLDPDKVDVIVIMYDASDYFAGHPACETEEVPAIRAFAGNLDVSLQILKEQYPKTRIIVMSPTYAFSDSLDENGDYLSSDIIRYGEDRLSIYVTKAAEVCAAAQVSFVDNFYVTFNEDNASEYLSDHFHLNQKGREKVIERLMYALNYFNAFYE